MPQTAGIFAILYHCSELFELCSPQVQSVKRRKLLVLLSVVNEVALNCDILAGVKQNAERLAAVAPGSSGLLIVAFNIARHIVMNNKRNVAFVNTHAESVGCNNNLLFVIDKKLLIALSYIFIKTCVIFCYTVALRGKDGEKLVRFLPCGTVDYAAFSAEKLKISFQRGELVEGFCNFKIKVRSVKAEDGHKRLFKTEKLHHIVPDSFGCGCGERADNRTHFKCGNKVPHRKIARSEILTPLRNAVRLVNADKADVQH